MDAAPRAGQTDEHRDGKNGDENADNQAHGLADRHADHEAGELEDAVLLEAHVAGDPYAFERLLRRHRDRLWAVAIRTTRDPEEAADALQDAMMSAVRAAGSFRAEAAVTTWLHRIVLNACLDRMRRRRTRPTTALPDSGAGEVADERDRLDERATSLAVTEALATLSVDQQAAITLVDLEGYSVADSARVLGVAEGTVKSRCARGRARLAVLLGHLRNPDGPSSVAPWSGADSRGAHERQ